MAGLLLTALASFAGGYAKGHTDADQSAKLAAQTNTIKALEEERNVYRTRTQALSQNAEEAARKRDLARADAIAAASTADGLRKRVANLAARAHHSAAASGRTSTDTTFDMFAQLLSRSNGAATDLAEYADRARLAGQQCEKDYQALTPSRRTP
ncbi:gp23 [Pandoraea sp. SD6-2]|nr:gp23 [Pandoraea sp. SD6-2]